MKKLKLNLDALQVDSFATDPDHMAETGTVQAHISGRVLCGPIEPGPPFERTIIASCAGFNCESFMKNCSEYESCRFGCIVSAGCPTRVVCPIDTIGGCPDTIK
jgi:hypothetical protein